MSIRWYKNGKFSPEENDESDKVSIRRNYVFQNVPISELKIKLNN